MRSLDTDDLVRATILLEAARVEDDALAWIATASACYENGDAREQQSWLRAISLLPLAERFAAFGIDACRSHIQPMFEAIACDNPYPAKYFPDSNFNQLVLKALFIGAPLARVVGLRRRLNPELSRMARDYASERRAAGRPVRPISPWRFTTHASRNLLMKIFDPHIHMTSRTTDDYEAMAKAGVVGDHRARILAGPAAHPRRQLRGLLPVAVGWERFRAGAVRHPALSAPSASTRRRRTTPSWRTECSALLPRYLEKDGVVAVGEMGYDDQTAAEDKCFAAQLELAREFELPVMIHTPHRDKKRGTSARIETSGRTGSPESGC